MKKTVLTVAMRQKIADAVAAHRFNNAIDDAISDRSTAALSIYYRVYSEGIRQMMSDLPEGWLIERNHFYAELGGEHTQVRLGLPMRFLAKNSATDVLIQLTGTDNSAQHYQAASNRIKAAREERTLAITEVKAVLRKFNTVEALLQHWPEIEPFVPAPAPQAQLPAVPIPDLNAKLGLPVAAAPAAEGGSFPIEMPHPDVMPGPPIGDMPERR